MKYKKYAHKSILMIFVIFLFTSLLGGCSSSQVNTTNESKTRIYRDIIYVESSMTDILKHPLIVIRGTVVGRGKSFERDYYESGDNASPLIYTPVIIEVHEWIIGKKGSDTIIYNEEGGETATKIMESYEFGTLKDAEEVIIILDKNGLASVPYFIFPIESGETVKVRNFLFPDLYKDAIKNDYKPVTMTVDKLISLIKSAAA